MIEISKENRELLPLSDDELYSTILGSTGGLASYGEPRATHADVQRIFSENRRQQAAMEAVKRKAIYYALMIKEIDKHGDKDFYELLKYFWENKRDMENTDMEEIAEQWFLKMAQVMGQQVLGGVKAGTRGIGEILASSPYPPEPEPQPEPEKPRSFWERLFG